MTLKNGKNIIKKVWSHATAALTDIVTQLENTYNLCHLRRSLIYFLMRRPILFVCLLFFSIVAYRSAETHIQTKPGDQPAKADRYGTNSKKKMKTDRKKRESEATETVNEQRGLQRKTTSFCCFAFVQMTVLRTILLLAWTYTTATRLHFPSADRVITATSCQSATAIDFCNRILLLTGRERALSES